MVDISVSKTGPVQPNINQTSQIAETVQTTGAGSLAQGGPLPDPLGQNYEMISQSLSKFFPTLTGDQVDTLVAEATMRLKEIVGETGTKELNAKEEQKRQSQAERRDAAEESQKQLDDAKAAAEKAKKSSGFGKFFNALVAIATIVAGAVLIATGAGAVAGAALLVAGTAAAIQLVDQIVMEQTGFGIAGNITILKQTADGVPRDQAEEAAKKADKGFSIALTVVMVVASVVAMRPDILLKSAGAKIMQMASTLSQATATTTQAAATTTQAASAATNAAKAADVAAKSAQMSKTATMAQHGANTVNAAATAGSASSQIATAKLSYDAANKTADANELQAKSLELQALTDNLNDAIDEIMTRISGENSIFNAMLDNVSTSIKDRGETLARARFAG